MRSGSWLAPHGRGLLALSVGVGLSVVHVRGVVRDGGVREGVARRGASGSSTTDRCARSSRECPRPESSSPFSAPVAFVHTVVISWRRSIGRHVSSIANVDVVPAADVAGFRTYRDSDAGTGSTRRDRVSRTGRPRHVRGRSVAGREARRPLTCPPTRQAEADELPPAIPCRASTPLRARLVAASWR